MPCAKLSALFDIPSSPLAPPPSGSDAMQGTTPAGSPSGHIPYVPATPTNRHGHSSSISPYASARSSRQSRRSSVRPFEDFTQAAVLCARKLKLKPEGVMVLDDYAKNATSVNEVKTFAQLLKITKMQALLSPTVATFVVPKKLDHKIDMHTFRTMMSPSLAFYVKKSSPDSPSGIMKGLITEHGEHWGVTNDILDDKGSWGVISSCVRTCLTDRRYDIKRILFDGVWISIKNEDGKTVVSEREDPVDIIQLSETLINLVPDAGVKVTLPMLGHIAVLRQVLVDVNGGPKFWEKVDEQLSMIREKYEHDEARISHAITKVLKNDCRTYGSPDLSLFQ
ncbi:hypothetical protein B0H14DRAFT_2582393 [Mycena olivaceomarginata]|nr:hypothetical protein B0H14DRAFT_2582393 [Mycena olivaceomarginata]